MHIIYLNYINSNIHTISMIKFRENSRKLQFKDIDIDLIVVQSTKVDFHCETEKSVIQCTT